MYYKKNKNFEAVLFENNAVVEQIELETEIVSTIKKPINCPHPEGIVLAVKDAQSLGIPESSEPLRYDVVERMATSLERSPFGTGYLLAQFLRKKFSDNQLLGMAIGHYRYYGERDPNSNDIIESTERMSYECTAPRIRWDLYVRYPYWIGEMHVKFRLGGGVHSAIYQFDRFTGELIDVEPDDIPSDVFYADGKADINHRRQWLMSESLEAFEQYRSRDLILGLGDTQAWKLITKSGGTDERTSISNLHRKVGGLCGL
jgi:hypothetical protein